MFGGYQILLKVPKNDLRLPTLRDLARPERLACTANESLTAARCLRTRRTRSTVYCLFHSNSDCAQLRAPIGGNSFNHTILRPPTPKKRKRKRRKKRLGTAKKTIMESIVQIQSLNRINKRTRLNLFLDGGIRDEMFISHAVHNQLRTIQLQELFLTDAVNADVDQCP